MADKKYVAYFSFLLSAVFSYLEVFRVDLTNDTNYFMHCALQLWKHGPAQLYDRCIDENFPYHIVAYAPLAAFSGYYHIEPAIVLHSVCVVFCVISLVVLSRVLTFHGISDNDRHLWLTASAAAFMIVPCIYGVFADREHFLFIFALPWMIQMVLRVKPLNFTCVMAGFGFLMKPHDFVLFGIMTVFCGPVGWSLFQRILSVSSLIIGAMGTFYVALVFLFFPAFVFEILPYSLIIYPSKYYPFSYKFGYAFKYVLIAVGIVLAFVRPWQMVVPWLAWIAGCVAVVLVNAGWNYTFYLSCVPMLLAFTLPWTKHYGGGGTDWRRMLKTVRLLIVGMFFLSVIFICTEMDVLHTAEFRNHNTVEPQLADDFYREAGDKMIILSLTTWNSQVERFAQTPEAVFGYDTVWTYPWLAENPHDPHYAEVLHSLTSHFLKAVQENPTAVIFDDISPYPMVTPDGILGFLMRDPEIAAALKPYAVVKTINYCTQREIFGCRFDVLKRQDIRNP